MVGKGLSCRGVETALDFVILCFLIIRAYTPNELESLSSHHSQIVGEGVSIEIRLMMVVGEAHLLAISDLLLSWLLRF